jgi:prolyl 4-hydroxylase
MCSWCVCALLAAILFHSIAPSGALERKSMHAACPVIKGQKWSAAKW